MPSDNETAETAEQRPTKLTDKELLTRIRKRFAIMEEADRHNRTDALNDVEFVNVPGKQWDKTVKDARGSRPCYEFNKTRIKNKRVVNEMRANRPAGKVRAVEGGDISTAQTMEGLGRNILQVSDFDTVCDYAGKYQVDGGMGAWRISTEYADDSFDQDIRVEAIPNPFNLYWDPASVDPMHRDADDWCLIDSMANSAFDEKYPDAKKINWEGTAFNDDADWHSEAQTRICEYHWKEPYKKRLIQLIDGRVLDASDPAATLIPVENIKRTRVATCHRILMCVASGDAIVEPPQELKGKFHRFIVVHGDWLVIKGKVYWNGNTRFAKDAQRAYNVASTSVTETVATAPNSHYWVTDAQAKGNIDQWNKAIAENLPFLQYTPDPNVNGGGPPQRTGGAQVPVALVQESQIRDQELKDVMGVYDTSLGDKSNETSGRAISRRNEQGQIVNFDFPDNMAKGKQRTVEIINDLIPFYYDTARTVRVLGVDGAEDYVKINTAGIDPKTGERVLLNDLTKGKYDVTVTVGPSFATQRQEASEAYAALAPQDPQLMLVAPDLVYQSMDLPYADQIAERRRAMLPPQIQALIKQGKELPPEVKQAKALVDAAKAELDAQGQLVQKASQEAEKEKAAADKAKADLQIAQANLKAEQARLAADRANFDAHVAQTQLAQAQTAQQQPGAGDGADPAAAPMPNSANVAEALNHAVETIRAETQQTIENALAGIAQVLKASQTQVVVPPPPPRPRLKYIERQAGKLVPVYEDTQQSGTVQ